MISNIDVLLIRSVFYIILLIFLFQLYKSYNLDRFRNRLFEIRDKLFDLAYDPKSTLDFRSKEYAFLRSLFNGSLRFAHKLNIRSFIINSISLKLRGLKINSKAFNRDLSKITHSFKDEYTISRIEGIIFEYQKSLVRHLFRSSWFFKINFFVIAVKYALHKKKIKESELRENKTISEVEYSAMELQPA